MKQTGEANLVSCLHIIISPRQLAPAPFKEKKKKSEKKKIASGLDSFLCLCDFDMLTCIRDCAVSKELKNHLRSYLGRNQAYYCEIVHNDAFCSTDMRQDKHIIHV